MDCLFCAIASREQPAHLVLDTPEVVAFLDHRPLFVGHTLVVPRVHVAELMDASAAQRDVLFARVQELARAIPVAMDAVGTFVAVNNVVSQSVPHLHVHVVPRRFKDGLRGFFWPRTKYESEEAAAAVADRIGVALRATM
ncbi:MAG: HIT family protein [Acidimicrobiia bacterium]